MHTMGTNTLELIQNTCMRTFMCAAQAKGKESTPEELCISRRDKCLLVEERFGPTGSEHALQFMWPETSARECSGLVKFTYAKGSEARIVVAQHKPR
jgi:hypothetical protein